MLLETKRADVVIAGACDFPVIRSLLASFASMNGAFRSRKPDDRAHGDPAKVSRPFSQDRKGFVVAEGSATLIVTTAGYAQTHGLPIRATVEGIGMTSDAKHYVAPSLPTIIACIREAIASAGRDADEIEVINAHAASTGVGDAVEAEALQTVFGDRTLPVCANKSQIGHTMGASSAIELILAVEGMNRGLIWPTINFDPDAKIPQVGASDTTRAAAHQVVLSNSFGFGGCNVCLVVSK
jgi:3-oxoacyl-[acyl-carrier-protein] synthase II